MFDMNPYLQKKMAENAMEAYDGLPPEFRAVVQEYGDFPRWKETPGSFRERMEQERRWDQERLKYMS